MAPNAKTFRSMQALFFGGALLMSSSAEAKDEPLAEYLPDLLSRGFHCGETFITFPSGDSFVWTLRKVDIQRVFWLKPKNFSVTVSKGSQTFDVMVNAAFIQPVIACLD